MRYRKKLSRKGSRRSFRKGLRSRRKNGSYVKRGGGRL